MIPYYAYKQGLLFAIFPFMPRHLKFRQEVLQGAAVTSAELGEYARASSLLQDLAKVYIILSAICSI